MLAHLHPQRVRTLVLDGVVPTNGDYPMRFAELVQRSFDQVVGECEGDPACRAAFPDPRGELATAQARLRLHPVTLTNQRMSVVFDGDAFAMLVRSFLGSPEARGYVPAVVHAAAIGNYDALADRMIDGQLAVIESQSVGVYLTVSCTETVPHATVADAERLATGSFLGAVRAAPIVRACDYWPKGVDIAAMHQPLRSDVPALLMSGTVDNATALDDARRVVAELPYGQWIVVAGGGHTVGGTPCMGDLIAHFLDTPLAPVDGSCVRPIVTRFAFVLPRQ
jgi:pimeloyl-ACP methyl ester carboxylesterase